MSTPRAAQLLRRDAVADHSEMIHALPLSVTHYVHRWLADGLAIDFWRVEEKETEAGTGIDLTATRFLFWQLDNPTSLVCGRLHPRQYLEQVLGLRVLEFRGSLMGGFIAVRVESLPADLTLPKFLREVEYWPTALRKGGDR